MSKQQAPFVVRWRNGVMDDPNPVLSWRALVAAMALTRWANVKTGHDCFPGAKQCAEKMRVSEDTIQRGWDELVAAGWLELKPLPAKARKTRGALKVLRWPAKTESPLTAASITADSGPTFTGNQEGLTAPGEAPHPGKHCRKHPAVEIYNGECGQCEHEAYVAKYGDWTEVER
jgi:Helix-turn-helix domain